jgi:hypothetical protein
MTVSQKSLLSIFGVRSQHIFNALKIKNRSQNVRKWNYLLFQKNVSVALLAMLFAVYIFPITYLLVIQADTLNFYGNITFSTYDLSLVLVMQVIYISFWIYLFKISKWYDAPVLNPRKYYFFKGELLVVFILYCLPLPSIFIYLVPFIFIALAGLAKVNIKTVLFYLLLFGIAHFLLMDGRSILINSLLLYTLFIVKDAWKVFIVGILLLFLSVFVLLPLRHGMPINLNINGLSSTLMQIYNGIVPIIIGAILSVQMNMTNMDFFVDYFPMGRTVFGSESHIDKIAYEFLPIDKYEEGVRVGSNPVSMFKIHLSGQLILIVTYFTILISSIHRVKKSLSNVLVIYLMWYFIMILRRGFTTFIADSIALLIISLLLIFLKYILPKVKNSNYLLVDSSCFKNKD